MSNVCGSKFPAELFTYANPLACLDIHLINEGLFPSVSSVTVEKPTVKMTNSNYLISALLNTADLEASLNPIIF